MPFEHLLYSVTDRIAIISLNRPPANSTLPAVYHELALAFLAAAADPAVVFTLFTGEGRFFCAGADVKG